MPNQNEIPASIATQLGYLTKDINLYQFMDQTGLGKSAVGKEMDLAGRHIFNHRMGGGHLWWKELANRPTEQWKDVLEHLASDLPTKQGLPFAFDYSHVNSEKAVELLGLKELSSSNNWGMLNAFDLVAGSVSIVFASYEFVGNAEIYKNDISLATDCAFIAINVGSGIATCNPLLIIGAIIKTGTMLRKMTASTFSGIDIHPGYFDVNVDDLIGVPTQTSVDVDELLGMKGISLSWS
jgi:hypothetical protein